VRSVRSCCAVTCKVDKPAAAGRNSEVNPTASGYQKWSTRAPDPDTHSQPWLVAEVANAASTADVHGGIAHYWLSCDGMSHQMVGALWMWLQLMWLQFEVVRGPVGVVWRRFGAGLGPDGPQTCPKLTANDRDRTSDNFKLRPHEL
jgi:hypothetical protein